jgi:glycosyltransferase 2 family protein
MKKPSPTVILLIIAIVAYSLFLTTIDFSTIKDALVSISPIHFLIAMLFWILGNMIRMLRWHYFIKRIGGKISFQKNVVYYFAGYSFVFTPGRLGELIRLPYIKRDYGLSLSKTSPILLIERIYDVIGLLIILCLGLVFANWPIIIFILPISITIFVFKITSNKKWILKILNKTKKINFKNMQINIDEFYSTTLFLTKVPNLLVGILSSSVVVIFQSSALYFLANSFDHTLNFFSSLLIYPLSMLIATASLIPAGIGSFEGGLVGLLVYHNVEYDTSVTISFLIRIISTVIFFLFGIFCLKILSKINHS